MKVGSLFSGIGGLDLGLERAGMRVVWQVENDPYCLKVLAKHWPDVPRYGDIKEINPYDLEPVDLICGGFPCQDLSVAGRRAGLAGKRSGLFYEFMRIADECAPAWVLIENVHGLLSSAGGRDMGAVLGTLGKLGYGWAYRVLDAQYLGVAQRRRRVFIVGCLGKVERSSDSDTFQYGSRFSSLPGQVLFEPESLPGDTPPSREAGARVTQSLTGGPGSSSCGNPDDNRAQGGFVIPVAAGYTIHGTDKKHQNGLGISEEGVGYTLDGTGAQAVACVCINADALGRSGEANTPSPDAEGRVRLRPPGMGLSEEASFALNATQVHVVAFSAGNSADAYGIALTEEGTPPLRVAEIPSVQYGMAVRRLTPTECERLQGFPDGWTDGQSDSARYRQLGNAVCVNVAEWIGRRIMAVAS